MKHTHRELVVYCNYCGRDIDAYCEGSYARNIKRARRDGWKFLKNNMDICPTCYAKPIVFELCPWNCPNRIKNNFCNEHKVVLHKGPFDDVFKHPVCNINED